MEWILQPWPWYIAGPLIGLMVPALLLLSGKTFGVSTSFQHLGAICAPKLNLPYLKNFDRRDNIWQLVFVAGIVLGAFVGSHFLSINSVSFLPDNYYTLSGMVRLALGGLLVGFGVRYAGGCTSGHTIMGLSNLQWSSLVASISFFAGGLLLTHVLQF